MNQGRFANFSPEPSNENFHQFGVILVRMFPYPFA